jgi:tRNA dimethylallyltransferase
MDLSGESIIDLQAAHAFKERPYEALKIGLSIERDEMYARIDERTDRMIAAGFEQEVRRLMDMGYNETYKPMRALGYKHFYRYLSGQCDREEALRLIKRDTRNYAKRQLTWFKADHEIVWVLHQDVETMEKMVDAFLGTQAG